MKFFAVAILFSIISITTISQVPDTEIYLVDINSHGDHVHLGVPQNITNRPGYDNQPYFLPDGSGILFTSIVGEGKADIYKYSFADATTTRVTYTDNEAEYSPVLTPDGRYYSVVQVEADDSTQRIWKFPVSGYSDPVLVFKKNKKVGYYAWMNENEIYAFVLGEPFTLQHFNLKKKKSKIIAEQVGRNVQKVPGKNAISFVHKEKDSWSIKTIDESGTISKIIETLAEEEDYTWMPDGTLLMGKAGVIYKYQPGVDDGWEVYGDLSATPAKDFYRIAVSTDGSKIAVVAYKGDKP